MRWIVLSALLLLAAPAAAGEPSPPADAAPRSLLSMDLTTLQGSPLPKDTLDGKVVLFVNVASRCGLTPQYEGLQQLYEAKKDSGFVIVGVPCNQFAGQEPGTADQIASFCKLNYGVTFPLLEKQEVNGPRRSELYSWLVDSEAGGGSKIGWNFEKFLVGRDGAVLRRFSPQTAPDDPALVSAIDAALN